MTQAATPPVLKHTARPWPVRLAIFVDLARGLAIHENGRRFETQPGIDLARLLNMVRWRGWRDEERPRVIYIVGGWNAATTPAPEWCQAPQGWERLTYHRDPFLATYHHPESKARATIYTTAQWFDECSDVELCQRAYVQLRELLRAAFDQGVTLMGTPARTGLDLLERSLPRQKSGQAYEYPVLLGDIREKLEHNIGQGRLEFVAASAGAGDEPTTLYLLDAIWMYAACCHHVPVLPVEHDQTKRFELYRPGFYRVKFEVPQGWQHIGLLPVWDARARKTIWPAVDDGQSYESFACTEELRLAHEQAWPYQILERWLFADEKAAPTAGDPLRHWIMKLRDLREVVSAPIYGELTPLLRSAVRALVIKAIGGLHRRGRSQLVETPLDLAHTLPDEAEIEELTAASLIWRRPVDLDSSMKQFQHPEWAATVWGRARARLARAALGLPRESLVALRNDALVTTVNPGWTGAKPGEFRVKQVLEGVNVPRDERAYRKLIRGVEHG